MRIVRAVVEWAAVLAVALGATLLLTSAAAYAECAWVLWLEQRIIGGGETPVDWSPLTGVPTSRDCYDSLKSTMKLQSKAEPDTTVGVRGGSQIAKKSKFSTTVLTYSCLPDTVDPRSPKAR
jgi:hypothetical protein